MEQLVEKDIPLSYPYKGSVREQMRYLLRYAVTAPSMYHTKPWRFRLIDTGVEVLADRSRLCVEDDPDGRGLFISLGAAIHHLTIAMRCYGLVPKVSCIEPLLGDPGPVATVSVTTLKRPIAEELELFAEILRGPQPSPHQAVLASEYVLMNLRRSMVGAGTGLVFADADWIVSLVNELEIEEEDPPMASALPLKDFEHLAFSTTSEKVSGLDAPAATARLAMPVMRLGRPDLESSLAIRTGTIKLPVCAILYSAGSSAADLLEIGRSIARLELVARRFGLRISPRYDLWDVIGFEERLRDEIKPLGHPHLVVEIEFSTGGVEVPLGVPLDAVIEDSGAIWPLSSSIQEFDDQAVALSVTLR